MVLFVLDFLRRSMIVMLDARYGLWSMVAVWRLLEAGGFYLRKPFGCEPKRHENLWSKRYENFSDANPKDTKTFGPKVRKPIPTPTIIAAAGSRRRILTLPALTPTPNNNK
jgi:hypothetical protein